MLFIKDNVLCFFSPIYFYQLEALYFTILQWFLPYIDMNQPWIYMYSPFRSISGLERSPGEGKCKPLQYFNLENSMDGTVCGGGKESPTTERLSLSLCSQKHLLRNINANIKCLHLIMLNSFCLLFILYCCCLKRRWATGEFLSDLFFHS